MSGIEVDPHLCNGYGNCVMIAPQVFELDEDTLIAVVNEDAGLAAPVEQLREAEADCPARAIKIKGRGA